MKKLRLYYFGDANSIHTKRWLSYFHNNGHDVLLVNTGEPISESLGFKVIDFPKDTFSLPILKSLFFIPKLRKLINSYNPDFVHIHFLNRRAIWAVLASSHPVIITVWGSDVFLTLKYKKLIAKLFMRLCFRKAIFVTTDSRSLLKGAFELGADRNRAKIIQFGVDASKFKPNLSVESLKAKYNLKNTKVIFSPRGIKEIYNIDIILKAYSKVVKEIPNSILLLANFNTYQEYEAYIKELIKKLDLEGKVIVVNSIKHSDMPKYFNLADVVVSVPYSDGTPVSLLEAMACGVGLVYSDLASIREWIKDGENGLLVPVGNENKTAQALVNYLGMSDEVRTQWSAKNIDTARKQGDHEANMKKMEHIYYKLRNSKK